MFVYNDLRISLIEESDLGFLLELRSSVWENLGTINMVNNYKQKKWFENVCNDPTKEYYIVSQSNDIKIGLIRTDEIDFINRSMRIGCDVHPDYQYKGYGTNIMTMLIKYCFDYLNMNRLWLMVLETNIAGQRLYKKVGFTEEGRHKKGIYRNGKYIDYILMSLIKEQI